MFNLCLIGSGPLTLGLDLKLCLDLEREGGRSVSGLDPRTLNFWKSVSSPFLSSTKFDLLGSSVTVK